MWMVFSTLLLYHLMLGFLHIAGGWCQSYHITFFLHQGTSSRPSPTLQVDGSPCFPLPFFLQIFPTVFIPQICTLPTSTLHWKTKLSKASFECFTWYEFFRDLRRNLFGQWLEGLSRALLFAMVWFNRCTPSIIDDAVLSKIILQDNVCNLFFYKIIFTIWFCTRWILKMDAQWFSLSDAHLALFMRPLQQDLSCCNISFYNL